MYLLNYSISRFWQVRLNFLANSSGSFCTIGIGVELSWSSCQIFDGTVKFVAQIFDGNGLGMVPYVFLVLCMTGIV